MTEQEYIDTEALGYVKSMTSILKMLVPESLKHIIKDGELKKVGGTLYDWQDRLYKTINTEEEISEEDTNYLLDVVKKEKSSAKKEKEYSEDVKMTYINCLEFFLEHLHPKTDNQKNSWLDTIDKLNRIDKIPLSEIERITQEARNDTFWSKNFLSLTKLRLKNKEKVPYIVVFNEKFKKKDVTLNRQTKDVIKSNLDVNTWKSKK